VSVGTKPKMASNREADSSSRTGARGVRFAGKAREDVATREPLDLPQTARGSVAPTKSSRRQTLGVSISLENTGERATITFGKTGFLRRPDA
jgi:hypothetical protein